MSKPIDGVVNHCRYLFKRDYQIHGVPDDVDPFWCTIRFSGDCSEPCTINDFWECEVRKMHEEASK